MFKLSVALTASSGYVLNDTNVIKGSITYDENYDDVYSSVFVYNNSLPKSDTIGRLDRNDLPYVRNRIKELEHHFYGDDLANIWYLVDDFFDSTQRHSFYPKRTVTFSCFGNVVPEIGTTISFYGVTYLVTSFTFGKLQNNITARRFD